MGCYAGADPATAACVLHNHVCDVAAVAALDAAS